MFGRMRFAEGRRDEAERLWTKAMAVRPEDYQVPLLMAMLYRGGDRATELEATQRRGIELARRQLAREPDDVRAMYLCAGALVERGSEEEGLSLLQRALEMAENDPSVLYNAACVFSRTGRHERALEIPGSVPAGRLGKPGVDRPGPRLRQPARRSPLPGDRRATGRGLTECNRVRVPGTLFRRLP